MAKPNKKKAGLQRKVSAVFKGVHIPQHGDDERTGSKRTPDGPGDVLSRPMPKDSLVSKSSLMKKVCQSKSLSDNVLKKAGKTTLAKRRASGRSASQDSPTQETLQAKSKPDEATRDRIIEPASERTVLNRLIPRRCSVEKPLEARDSSDKATPERAIGVPPKLTAPDDLSQKRILEEEPAQIESLLDIAEPDPLIEISPEETNQDRPAPQPLTREEVSRGKDSSDKVASERASSIPSWMMSPEYAGRRNSLVNEITSLEDSSGREESDLAEGDIVRTARHESTPRYSSAGEGPPQTEDVSDEVAPSRKSWVPPKLTTPDHPISKVPLTPKTEQAERPDEAEPDRTDVGGFQKHVASNYTASQKLGTKKLDQTQKTSAPDRIAKASSTKSADPKSIRHSGSEKRYGPETPPKESSAPTQHEKAFSEKPSGPSLRQRINDKLFVSKPGVSPVRQKVMALFIPILVIAFIFTFRQVLNQSPRKTKGDHVEDVAPVVETDSGHEIDWQIPEPLPSTMRDPTKLPFQSNIQTEKQAPKESVDTKRSKLVNLGAIVYSQDKPSAIVNGRIVHVGEQVSGITILKINKDSVEFEKKGKKWIQKMRD